MTGGKLTAKADSEEINKKREIEKLRIINKYVRV
tara:strand:- start:74 stop:175 length:102 start_codon:yes stop_codon:yes gene_type:complete